MFIQGFGVLCCRGYLTKIEFHSKFILKEGVVHSVIAACTNTGQLFRSFSSDLDASTKPWLKARCAVSSVNMYGTN